MADVNLPSISELSQMQFLAPGQYQTAQQNINLANQFQNQNLHQGEANLQSTLLKNSFDAANNPISLQGNQGLADTRTAEAILKGIDAKQRQSLAPEEQEAKRAKFIKDASDDKLADLMNRTQQDMMDPNAPPEKQQAAKEAFERSSKEWSARLKAKDELKKQSEEYAAKSGIADKEIAGRADVANIMAGSREKVAGMKQKQQAGYSQALAGAKNPEHAANIAEAFAASSQDPTEIKYFQDEAARFRAAGIASKAAGAGITASGKIDIPATAATGIVTNQANPVPPVPAPTARPGSFVPGARGDIQPQAGGPTNQGERQMAGTIASPSFDSAAAQSELNSVIKDLNDPAKAKVITAGDRQRMTEYAQQLQHQINNGGNASVTRNPGTPVQAGVKPPQPTIRDDGKVNVVRPDGKAGWISKSDLDEAIKNGWKIK